MSPIEYIENGIKTGNWETVCEGFEQLTGRSLPLPVDQPGEARLAKDALQEIISIATEFLQDTNTVLNSIEIESKSPKKKKKPGRPRKNKKKKTDDDEDYSLILDDNKKTVVQRNAGEIQLITNDPNEEEVKANKVRAKKAAKNKLKLDRKAPETFNATCSECEETFKSDRPDGQYGQKCPKCLNSKKSRST